MRKMSDDKVLIESAELLKGLELPWYIKDDLIDLLEEYPNLFLMPESQLKEIAREKYSKADSYNSKASRLENEAGAIEKYCKAKYGEDHES